MQRDISNRNTLGDTLNPIDDARRSAAIDRTTSNYNDAKEKVQKIRDLINMGKYDADLAKYIPGLMDLAIQGILDDIDTREKVAHPSYKDKEQLDFQILLTENYYVNPANIHICFPIKIKKKSNDNYDIDSDLITVNNFFAHSVKEISITKYGSDKELSPTFSPLEVYQYSDQMLKHLPADDLKSIQKTFLFSKKPVYFANTNYDRKNFNSKDIVTTGLSTAEITKKKKQHAKDLNIDDRIDLFEDQIVEVYVYRIPLRYFSDIGKINFPTKIDYRIKLFLETDMNKLFESRKVLASTTTAAPAADAEKTPIQKTYEIKQGSDSLNVEFLGANRQFDWIEISIVPDKSDKHTTIYDSYNREMASQLIKTLQLSNFTEIYSLTNEKRYNIDNLTQKHLLYKQFVAWNCNGSSVAPITDYMGNPIFRELPDEEEYFSLKSDEKVYLDLRATSGYVKEAEKLERNDSKINLQITLKK